AFVDFIRFIGMRFIPGIDKLYPLGIPANMVLALMLATSIVRYRLFDVTTAVKKSVVYAAVCAIITSGLVVGTKAIERYFDLAQASVLWIVVPIGFVMTLLLGPLGQRLEEQVERLMFSKRRGASETLLDLS